MCSGGNIVVKGYIVELVRHCYYDALDRRSVDMIDICYIRKLVNSFLPCIHALSKFAHMTSWITFLRRQGLRKETEKYANMIIIVLPQWHDLAPHAANSQGKLSCAPCVQR